MKRQAFQQYLAQRMTVPGPTVPAASMLHSIMPSVVTSQADILSRHGCILTLPLSLTDWHIGCSGPLS